MNTDYHSIDELIANESFIEWVLDPKSDRNGYWDHYRKRNPQEVEVIERASQFVLNMNAAKIAPTDDQKSELLEAIHKGLPFAPTKTVKLINWKMIGQIAAVFAFVLGGYFMINTNNDAQFITKYNERQHINLPDGSKVILNSNSTLTHSGNWKNARERKVWLSGEAFFNVSKSDTEKDKKFIVHTDDLDVTVLGTQFNVNTHKEKTAVVLEEGKVDITITSEDQTKSANALAMLPGQKASFSPSAKKYQVTNVNTAVYTSWKDGTVVFDGTPLAELKGMIENNYGYEVQFENDALLSKKLDGKINSPDLETLLSTLEAIFNLQIQKSGNQIIIKE